MLKAPMFCRSIAIVFAMLLTNFIIVSASNAQGFYQHNLAGSCQGSPSARISCLNHYFNALQAHQKEIERFPEVLAEIRGTFSGSFAPISKCEGTLIAINGSVPTRTPPRVSSGLCRVQWNNYASSVGAYLSEVCETKAFYQTEEKNTALHQAAAIAEEKYDACFSNNMRATPQLTDFSDYWGIQTITQFIPANHDAHAEYRKYNFNGQLSEIQRACRTALNALAQEDRELAEQKNAQGVCR